MTPQTGDALDLILGRRSVRGGFTDHEVDREVLEEVVACALSGPSSKGATPVRLTVVTDRARLVRIAELVRSAPGGADYTPYDPSTGRPHAQWQSSVSESATVLAGARAAVFVANAGPFSGGRQALLDAEPRARELALTGFELELAALGAALENMWLAANAHGLAAAFLGDVGVAAAPIGSELGLVGDLLGVLVLGYASSDPAVPRRAVDSSAARWDP